MRRGHGGGESIAQMRIPGARKADLPPVVTLKQDSGALGSWGGFLLWSRTCPDPLLGSGQLSITVPDSMLPSMVLGLLKQEKSIRNSGSDLLQFLLQKEE